MAQIIVTVTNKTNSFEYDIEFPSDIAGDKLQADIIEALSALTSLHVISPLKMELYDIRLKKTISGEATMEENGVWNGDYLILRGSVK